jgi:hypothetical protein
VIDALALTQTILSMFLPSGSPESTLTFDWGMGFLTIGLWFIGILIARKRQRSLGSQVTFTIIMLGLVFSYALASKGKIPGLETLGKGSLRFAMALVMVLYLGFGFYKRKFSMAYIFMVIAIALIFSGFVFDFGYVTTYLIYAISLLLLLAAGIVSIKRKEEPRS